MCNTSFFWDFDWKIHLKYYFGDSRSCARSNSTQGHTKVNPKVKNVKIWFLANTNSRRSVVRRFDVILTEKPMYVTILTIKGNLKVIASISRPGKKIYDSKQMKPETSVIPLFCVILSEISFSNIILVILDDPLGQKVISR